MNFIEKITPLLTKVFVFIAGVFLSLMVLLTCLNIVFRLCGHPIRGVVELMGFFGAITATFALAYTQIKKDHISVTVLFDYFPESVKIMAGSVNDLMCMLFSLIAAVQITKIAKSIFNSGEVTETLRIAFYPFVYAAAVGFFFLVAIFLIELVKIAINGFAKEPDVFEKEFEAEDN